ncbi:MAG: flagellar basal body L-ring protein FlgH [Deltaproteobacteria bacterium]|nr:flagellar basal body L-ring protein FlgH [Deltaproteobacteria bacterium]
MKIKYFCLGALGLFGMIIGGCGHQSAPIAAAVPVVRPSAQPSSAQLSGRRKMQYKNGSLVNLEQSGQDDFIQVFNSRRARYIDDIVYVLVSEDFSGTGAASTSSDGTNSSKYSVPGLFALKKYLGDLGQMDDWLETERSNTTSGTGTTSRSNTLAAKIASRVTEILPNGDFRILGTHFTQVNNEDHYVTVSGIIRPTDISADNYILSSAIAEARIEYSGSGTIGTKQGVGWGTKVLDLVWPF